MSHKYRLVPECGFNFESLICSWINSITLDRIMAKNIPGSSKMKSNTQHLYTHIPKYADQLIESYI